MNRKCGHIRRTKRLGVFLFSLDTGNLEGFETGLNRLKSLFEQGDAGTIFAHPELPFELNIFFGNCYLMRNVTINLKTEFVPRRVYNFDRVFCGVSLSSTSFGPVFISSFEIL